MTVDKVGEMRAVIVSNVLDLILPFFGTKIDGVRKFDCVRCEVCSQDVWHYNTEKMPASPSKAKLKSQGVAYSIRTPLIGEGHIIGYMAATWDTVPEKMPDNPKTFCDHAEMISYLLGKRAIKDIKLNSC